MTSRQDLIGSSRSVEIFAAALGSSTSGSKAYFLFKLHDPTSGESGRQHQLTTRLSSCILDMCDEKCQFHASGDVATGADRGEYFMAPNPPGNRFHSNQICFYSNLYEVFTLSELQAKLFLMRNWVGGFYRDSLLKAREVWLIPSATYLRRGQLLTSILKTKQNKKPLQSCIRWSTATKIKEVRWGISAYISW